nr:serine/threonine-protein kinase [Micromonospora sp. DSM 115978]
MTPERVGGYRLVKPLGAGGMGEVYFAVSPTADRVALKVIKPHLVRDETFRDRFAAEIESLKTVYGSRVARLEDADPYGDPAWLAVEYVPGATLRQYIDARGPLPLPGAAMIGAMLADGLAKVHQAGLLHRDLKPQNIILGPDGPKVIDFGLAVLVDREHFLTQPGMMVGTPAFMAPEQVTGERALTPAVDIYGLAATLVFALTGHTLYPDSHGWNLLLRVSEPDDLPDMAGVPVEVAPLIGAMLAFDPTARPSLDAVRSRLLEVATTVSGSSVADLRREVGELTYDAGTELVVPPGLTDPRRDPEQGTLGPTDPTGPEQAGSDPAGSDPTGPDTTGPDPGNPEPGTPQPTPPQADVSWLVEQVRHRYARRPNLLGQRSGADPEPTR